MVDYFVFERDDLSSIRKVGLLGHVSVIQRLFTAGKDGRIAVFGPVQYSNN